MKQRTDALCLCPSCGALQDQGQDNCTKCETSLILRDRYILMEILGQGTGITYKAHDLTEDKVVVVKELAIRRLNTWKTEELFLREGEVLRKLDHPQIPKYIDHFFMGQGKQQSHYLIQAYIPGKNLQQMLNTRSYTESEVRNILLEALKILSYLQNLCPPVIHRDIKLSNLLQGDDGKLYLLDFGSVKDITQLESRGETVAGTFGYMAPEQFKGKATPQSDLYALGVVALAMLSRQEPDKFMDISRENNWQSKIKLTPAFQNIITKMLAHSPKERFSWAGEAIEILEGKRPELLIPSKQPTQFAVQKTGGMEKSYFFRKLGEWEPAWAIAWLALGIIGFVVVIFPLVFAGIRLFEMWFFPRPKATMTAVAQETPKKPIHIPLPCVSPNCQPVPTGLIGLSFGMTLQDVKKALPNAKFGQLRELPDIPSDGHPMMASVGGFAGVKIPGKRLYLNTKLAGKKSRCKLDFGIQHTLSQIECHIKMSDPKRHKESELKLLYQLQQAYGMQGRVRHRRHLYQEKVKIKLWIWDGKKSRLVLHSAAKTPDYSYNAIPYYRLELSLTWWRWDRLFRLARKEANRRKALRSKGKYLGNQWNMPAAWRLPKGFKPLTPKPLHNHTPNARR